MSVSEWRGWLDPRWLRRQWDDNGMLSEDGGTLMVALGEDAVGCVTWGRRQSGFRSFCWTIGITLAPEARSQGCGAAAQRLLAHYLLSQTQVTRIEAETEVGNRAEQRALEKAGFSCEGVLRSVSFRDGQWRPACPGRGRPAIGPPKTRRRRSSSQRVSPRRITPAQAT